jgi:hypothetical protein
VGPILLPAQTSAKKFLPKGICKWHSNQFKVFRWFYPSQALLVALFLAVVPYLLLRGPANRITRSRNDARKRTHQCVHLGVT